MKLKNALAVCLIALFSATLVLLIARSLDNQAAARLEPQLARIVDELEAIRKQGGVVSGGQAMSEADGVVMYYFHGNVRCPTCKAIESQSHEALSNGFANEVKRGAIVWKLVNYEDDANVDLKNRFDIQVPVVVLARRQRGETVNWKRLDQVWTLWDDEPAFASFMQDEIRAILDEGQATDVSDTAAEEKNTMETDVDPAALPLPTAVDSEEG